MRSRLLARLAHDTTESKFQGIPIVVEWAKGSTRTGTNSDGEEWERQMLCDYGHVPDTKAAGDGEGLDVYVGPEKDAPTAFVVEQLKDDGSFDEPKCMLGFASEDDARKMYLAHYPVGWEDHIGDVYAIPVSRLRELVEAEQNS